MPKESLGYVKLEWTCSRCGSRNPGPQKTCISCGNPQPDNVQFEQAETQEILKEQVEINAAKKGADIHCPYCGARNVAAATSCMQCGGDLKGGKRREVGQVIGAFKSAPEKQIPCPNCGTPNPEKSLKCKSCGATLSLTPKPKIEPVGQKKSNLTMFVLFGILAAFVLCVGIFALLTGRTEDVIGEVQSKSWTTRIAIEALEPVTHEGWLVDIPTEAELGNCAQKLHHIQDEPADNANKVCGTPYTLDTGTGYGEVVQDCQYEVYQDYCQYTSLEWQQVDVAELTGSETIPDWPEPQLATGQRLGQQEEIFSIQFSTDQGILPFVTNDQGLFQQCQVGSRWILNINAFDTVVAIEPVN